MGRGIVVLMLLAWALSARAEAPPGASDQDGGWPAIRGLTPREVEDLREGHGMGLARAAELNGYPGPRHLLDAARAGRLHLTPDQQAAVERLFADMAAEARRLGARVLEEERGLEAALRAGTIDDADLAARLGRSAAIQAELRRAHLRAHLRTRALLSAHQVERYNALRGYASGVSAPGGAPPAPHH